MSVTSATINVVVLWAIAPWRPDLSLRWDALRDLSKFSLNLVGYSIFNYWTRNGDNLLIGRYDGSAALGIYARSYTILLVPVTQIAGIITHVMFPALSAIQQDVERVRETYLSAISIVSLATFPLMLGLLVVSRSFVLALFGEKWAPMIPILQVFCLLGMLQSIDYTTGWLYTSQGRTDILFRWGLIAGTIYITSFVVGLRWGAFGVAVAYTIANLFLWYPNWSIPARLIDLNFLTMLKKLSPTFCVAAAMAVAIWALGLMFPSNWSYLIRLAVQVLFGIMVYWGLLHLFKVDAYRTASNLVFKLLGEQ